MLGVEVVNADWLWRWLAPRILKDRKSAIEKAAAYQGKEQTCEEDYLFVLDGVKGGEMVWGIPKATK